jgi:hypothetical protein
MLPYYRIRMRIWEAQKRTDPSDQDPDADPEYLFVDVVIKHLKSDIACAS